MRKLARMLYHTLKTRGHWKWERKKLTRRKIRYAIGYEDVIW